jgi:phosphatidylinositol glycan class W
LSIDFPSIFPRSMGKTELYGLSLMDIGVGEVIFVSSMNRRDSNRSFIYFFIRTLPVLLLGISRFIFVTAADYYVAPTEYGVHWNFFLTLWVVAVCVEALKRLFNGSLWLIGTIACVLALVPSLVVSLILTEDWFFFGARNSGFFSANREGIISTIGFVALDLLGHVMGRSLKSQWTVELLIGGFLGSCLAFTVTVEYGFFPSRRMGNASFIMAVVVVAFFNLLCFRSVENSLKMPKAFVGFLRQPLAFFLGSNILTGLVNIFFRTLLFPQVSALLIMGAYVICLRFLGEHLLFQ